VDEWGRARALIGMALPRERTFPGYELLRRLGGGASGTVYRARRLRDDALVALKIMRDAYAATDAELARFRRGAQAGQALSHANIVRVRDFGEKDGEPFVEMDLIEGRSLDSVIEEERPSAEKSAILIAKVAGAVGHAHEHEYEVVHRDLKPGNILIDSEGEPHVTDFDLAKPLRHPMNDESRVIAGTTPYMAPEQLAGESTAGTDIYSLGVTFYELLTGGLPFRGESVEELHRQIRDVYPAPPRAFDRRIKRSFETICLTCLEKDRRRRYRSARELADDCKRALRDEPIVARPRPAVVRAFRCLRRRPRLAAALAATLFLVGAMGAAGLVVWRAMAREQARAMETNAVIATGQAGAMLFQLRAYAERVERASKDPVVTDVLARKEVVIPAPAFKPLVVGLDTVFITSPRGEPVAQWPEPVPQARGRNYAFRDYFQGALRLARLCVPGHPGRRPTPFVYVSRAFRSEANGALEFAFATPLVRDEDCALQGVFVITYMAKAVFGAVRMDETSLETERITTALVGPRGNDRGAGPDSRTPSRYTFLAHPGLDHGAEYPMDAPSPEQLHRGFGAPAPPGEQFVMEYVLPLTERTYRDPVPGFAGEWLAALAPVGKTGFVVLVETPRPKLALWP
jgi:eukaryotic-like serine/threonine-protein kinase